MKPLAPRDAHDPAAEARYQRFLSALHVRRQERIFRPASRWSVRRWIPLAATAALAVIFLFLAPQNALIQADELVQHAASAERARPVASTQWFRITHTPTAIQARRARAVSTLVFDLELTNGIVTTTAAITPAGNPSTLIQMLAQHHFAWREPLSVARFNDWRSSLAHKRDEVIDAIGSSVIILRTTTSEDGDLHEVEITVERESYRVIREAFRFETVGLLTIAESASSIRHSPPASVAEGPPPAVSTPEPPARASAAAVAAPPQPDLAAWRERIFRDSSTSDTFMPEFRRLTGVAREHLAALRDLAVHDPSAAGTQSSPMAQARFERQRDLQYQTLCDDLDRLRRSIQALIVESNEKRQAAPSRSKEEPAPADWARRVDAGLASAATLDRLADQLRAYDDLPPEMCQRLGDSFYALWDAIYTAAR